MSKHYFMRAFPCILVLAVTTVLLACGDDDEPTATTPATTGSPVDGGDEEIDISGVPELEDGTLSIGSDIAYAPIEFYEEGTETPAGLDVDMAEAMAEALGVEFEFINTGFDGIIEALNTEDYDIIMSAMTINPEREAEIDLVPYVNVGTGILVAAGNPEGIADVADLCGLTVAVQLGTIQETLLQEQNATCEQEIEIVTFDTNPLAVEDLRTGGSDANLADFPVSYVDAQESDGDLEVLDVQIDPAPVRHRRAQVVHRTKGRARGRRSPPSRPAASTMPSSRSGTPWRERSSNW